MKHRNEILYEAMREYVRAAADFVARHMPAQALKDTERESSAMGEAFFYARLSSRRDLVGLPEYKRCHEALLADRKIAAQLDVLVGTSSRMSRSPTAEQLMGEILSLGVSYGDYRFDPERFEREYVLFEEAFYSDDILYDVVAPLENLLIRGAVRLSDDFEIRPLTEKDIEPYGTSKAKLDKYRRLGVIPCAVSSKFRAPKIIRRDDEQDAGEVGSAERAEYYDKELKASEKDRARQELLNERIEEVVNALRLFGVETVFHGVIIYRASKWFGHDFDFPNPVRGVTPLVYDLNEDHLNAFAELWKTIQSEGVRRRKFISLAMRRFGYAHERHRAEDRIIDLLIAAEAMFLSDTGSATYRGELQYRLAQRAGFLLGGDPAGRIKVYRHLKEAYKLRSKVVHGGNPGPLKLEDGRTVSMEEFVETTKAYLRLALHKIIDLALRSQPSGELVKWDEMVFAGGSDINEAAPKGEDS